MATEPITRNNDTYQVFQALKTNRKKRSELSEIFIEGTESIKQADSAQLPFRSILRAQGSRLSDWATGLIARHPAARVYELSPELYAGLSDRDEPSELMVTAEYSRPSLADFAVPDDPLILIFDRPSDCGNLGSIIRSANAFGVDVVITTGHSVDIRDPKVIRSSLGAVFHTPVIHEESTEALERFLAREKAKRGLVVAGTDSTGAVPLGAAGLRRPLALILGNEAKGMSVRLKQSVDLMVSIPMVGAVNSLNVACAATVLLWQAISNQTETRS